MTDKKLVKDRRILVCQEKHGTPLYDIPDDEALFRTALFILKERVKDQWIVPPSEDEAPVSPGMTREQAEALPEGSIKRSSQNLLKQYEEAMKRHRKDLEEWASVEKALKEKDGKAAWSILQGRRDYEYEGVFLEPLLSVPEKP